MRKNNLNKIVTIILCCIFGFSIIITVNYSLHQTNFCNYPRDFENDDPTNLKIADDYFIPEPVSDHLWSPDGTKIAYIKPPVGQTWNCEIWIADKTPNSAQLINHQLIYSGAEAEGLFDWKGDWLLIMIRFEEGTPSSYYGRNELWKIRTDGNDLTQLTFTNTNGIRTTWSNTAYTNRGTVSYANFIPGTNLVYFTAHNGNGWYKSFVCNDDGTDGWYHISDPDYAFRFNLSPTGNKLLWGHATSWNYPTTLRASNVDGSGRTTIKVFTERTQFITLADGNTIIWHSNDNIYAIDMDGSNERTVIDDGYINMAWNYNPANGQELIFGSSSLDGNMHLFKMNIDGSDILQLSEAGPYIDELPILSPDGQYISYLRLPYDFDKLSNPKPWPYELVVKSLITTPIITINSPNNDVFFKSIAPNYDITITGEYEAVWCTIDQGITNITITELTGTIDQVEWDKVGDGAVNLRFYVNNTIGNLCYSEVSINKDTIAPIVTINSPLGYELFGKLPPSFELSIVEFNIDSMWYSLDGGSTNISFQEFTGTINQNEWDKCGNGTVIINFYVKDEADNEGAAQVTIRKEATPPLITIISPNENDFFPTIAPTFELAIQENNLDTTWYTFDDGVNKIIFTGLTGSIDQTEWDKYGNASIVLKFYANDSYGFENFAQVMVHKDISEPIITVNSPQQDEIFSSIAPVFNITIIDSQLDSMWYTIDNGLTNILITSTVGTIDQTEWEKIGGGNIPIRFYANDTLGNTAYTEVVIIKDIFYGMEPIELLTPSAFSQIFNDFINFSWSSLDAEFGAVNYTLQISNLPNFNNVIFQSGNIAEIPIVTNFSVPLSMTQGQYYWRVCPTYGIYNGSWSNWFSFTLHINDYVPNLAIDDISPTEGTSSTIFCFTVIYSDLDNNIPEYVKILIDGIPHFMERVDPLDENYTDGCIYQYLTLLAPSATAYTISFECFDGVFQHSTSTYQGPLVESDSAPNNDLGNEILNSTNVFAITMTLGITIGSVLPFIAFAEIKTRKIKKLGDITSTKIKKKQIKS